MKTSTVLAFVSPVFILISTLHADNEKTGEKTSISKRKTSEDLQKKRDLFLKEQEKSNNLQLTKKRLITDPKKRGTISRSTVLTNKGFWTKVPKGSVIYTPKHLKNHIIPEANGKILTWNKFYKKNSGWIHTHSVTIDQARGVSSIDQKVIDAYQSMGKLVVATFHNAPISVLPEAFKPQKKKSNQ